MFRGKPATIHALMYPSMHQACIYERQQLDSYREREQAQPDVIKAWEAKIAAMDALRDKFGEVRDDGL